MGEIKRYVCGFAFHGDMVALVTKARPDWQRGKVNGVGGKIEEGEAPYSAIVREFAEEANIQTTERDWTHFATLVGDDTNTERLGAGGNRFEVWFFRCTINDYELVHELHGLPDEPVKWYSTRMLQTVDSVPNLRWLVPMAAHSRLADEPLLIKERATSEHDLVQAVEEYQELYGDCPVCGIDRQVAMHRPHCEFANMLRAAHLVPRITDG